MRRRDCTGVGWVGELERFAAMWHRRARARGARNCARDRAPDVASVSTWSGSAAVGSAGQAHCLSTPWSSPVAYAPIVFVC